MAKRWQPRKPEPLFEGLPPPAPEPVIELPAYVETEKVECPFKASSADFSTPDFAKHRSRDNWIAPYRGWVRAMNELRITTPPFDGFRRVLMWKLYASYRRQCVGTRVAMERAIVESGAALLVEERT